MPDQNPPVSVPAARPPKLLDQVRRLLQARHMSAKTAKSYVGWIRRNVLFHGKRHPAELAEAEVNAFLTHLAAERRVSASTQTQALCALILLYRHVGVELGELEGLVRARRTRRLPGFLFPVAVLRRLFRGKLLAGLKALHTRGHLRLPAAGLDDPLRFLAFLSELYGKEWVVHVRPPFAGPEIVLRHLGRYTHRIAISNQRLVGLEGDAVLFRYKDRAADERWKTMRLSVRSAGATRPSACPRSAMTTVIAVAALSRACPRETTPQRTCAPHGRGGAIILASATAKAENHCHVRLQNRDVGRLPRRSLAAPVRE